MHVATTPVSIVSALAVEPAVCGTAEGSASIAQPRVLVVDDDPRVLETVYRTLTRSGFCVTTAEGVAAAKAQMQVGVADVVITDLRLADGDGNDVLSAAREREPDVAVLFMSGSEELDPAVRALEAGVLRYLRKPIGGPELCAAVHSAFAVQRRRRRGSGWGPRETAERSQRLTAALADLYLVYQPIVSCRLGRAVAYEALMRSRHSSLGRPDRLLAAAEQLDRVLDVGRAVRREVLNALPSLPSDCDIYVNLHPAELEDPELFDSTAPLTAYAHRLVLEVTERAALASPQEAAAQVRRLRELGYRVAVDDLGSGYASLSLVAELAPDLLKIDMSLVRGVHRDHTKKMLLATLLSVGRQLSLGTVIEGIETRDDLDSVLSIGADLVQGYLFAKPSTPPPQFDIHQLPDPARHRDLQAAHELAAATQRAVAELTSIAAALVAEGQPPTASAVDRISRTLSDLQQQVLAVARTIH